MPDLDAFVAAVGAHRDELLVALDFDGTLAPIVDDPRTSQIVPDGREVLHDLTAAGIRIAIITGRGAETVIELGHLGDLPGLLIEGIYGAERWVDDHLLAPDPPAAVAVARERIAAVVADLPGAWIEDKKLSFVVHVRAVDEPDVLDRLRPPIEAEAAVAGLEVHPGRAVLELRLPGYDKGAALHRAMGEAGRSAVLYAGDDVGDHPAFDAVADLRRAGRAAWSIAVESAEVPDLGSEVAADVTVGSPIELVALLRRLAG